MSATPTRGRRVLLWALGLFVLLQQGIGLILDRRVVEMRFTVLRPHLARLQAGAPPDIVCLGSSRTGSSIIDGELTRVLRAETGDAKLRAFNSAIPVGDTVAVDFVVGQLLTRGIRPRLVVLELLPEEVNRTNTWVPTHIFRQLTWADVPEHLRNIVTTSNLLRFLTSRLLPTYAFRKEILREVGLVPGPPEMQPIGDPDAGSNLDWFRILGADKLPPAEAAVRTRAGTWGIQKDLVNYAIGGPSRAALERTLTRLRAAHIEVLLLGIPVATAHREQYTPEIERDFQNYLHDLRERFGVRYVDCRASLADELFLDHHHAMPAGGVQFAGILGRDVLAPFWRERFGSR